MTAKNDLRLVILSLGLGLVLTGMGVRAIACQNSSNRPPQPPLTKGGIKRGLLIKGGLNPKITLPSVLMMMLATPP